MKDPDDFIETDGNPDGVLIENGLFSSALKSVLRKARFEQASGAVKANQKVAKVQTQPAWSLASVITSAASSAQSYPNGAASIFLNNSHFVSQIRQDSQWPGGASAALSTRQVANAIRDAIKIREVTGGMDAFIGLRHALFSILVPEDPEAHRSLFQMIADASSDPMQMAKSIADFCQQDLEKGESEVAWKKIVDERLPGVLALDILPELPQEVPAARSDDPWATQIVDHSGAKLEAEAFASMITWRDFKPPIAVGVFGDWGAGKSFFMRLVHDAIDSRCKVQKTAKKDEKFLDHVVQIRFNAWHYAETNLWASLVDHLLTELDAWAQKHEKGDASKTIFNRLDTAREQTLEAAIELRERRRAKRAAEASYAAAEEALNNKRQDLLEDPQVWIASAWEETWKNAAQDKLGQAAKELGLTDDLPKTAEELRQAAALYDPQRGPLATRAWMHFISQHPFWSAITLLLVLALPAVLAAGLAVYDLSPVGGVVGGVLAPLIAGMALVSRGLRKAHAKMSDVHIGVQSRIAEKSAQHKQSQAVAEHVLRQAEADLATASEHLKNTEQALDVVKQDYETQEGKGRVLKFVRDRITAGGYRKQLSFIAEIRRDFDQLSLLMNKATAPIGSEDRLAQHRKKVEEFIAADRGNELMKEDEIKRLRATYATADDDGNPPVFERIVLYIDDLDRCPAEQVVVVLQAIHLLLAYPLFVVFVAVDVRWLRAALEKEYPQFARDLEANMTVSTQAESQPEPSDYLEKIFQLPYWVRAMNEKNSQDLLYDLMAAPQDGEDVEDEETDPSPAPDPITKGEDAPIIPQKPDLATKSPQAKDATPPEPVRLEFSQDEKKFVGSLAAGLDGSPRRALRFINSYRLIKASLPADRRAAVGQGGFRAILTLLAIQVGQFDKIDGSDCCKAVMTQIETSPSNLLTWARELPDSDTRKRLLHVLETFSASDGQWSDLAENHDLVARFSFEMVA